MAVSNKRVSKRWCFILLIMVQIIGYYILVSKYTTVPLQVVQDARPVIHDTHNPLSAYHEHSIHAHLNVTHNAFNNTKRKPITQDIILYGHNHRLQQCLWSNTPHPKEFVHSLFQRLRAFQILRKATNLKFILSFGSLLGAYRGGGFIPWDHDLDIIIPIWLNLDALNDTSGVHYDHCDKAHQMLLQTLYNNQTRESQRINKIKKKLCGLTLKQWTHTVAAYLNTTLEAKDVGTLYVANRQLIQWIPHPGTRADMFITINFNKWALINSTLCLCKFNTLRLWCYQDASTQLELEYGPNFMVTNKSWY
eukprot:644616_1